MATPPVRLIIADAGPLIILSRVRELGLLQQVFGQVTANKTGNPCDQRAQKQPPLDSGDVCYDFSDYTASRDETKETGVSWLI